MNNEDRTTAIGLARYAREYHDSAIAADEVIGQRNGFEIGAPAPVMFLIAHSVELALKAYLRHRGFGLDSLKKLGHELADCWKVAVEHGWTTSRRPD